MPVPDLAVYAIGMIELVGGFLLVVGLCTRPTAAILAATMVGAIATAGRVDGGSFHLGSLRRLLCSCCFLSWSGSGAFALDQHLPRRSGVG